MKARPILLLLGAALCFALALADQLSSGDLYRRASTLRIDRDGSSVWFEALVKTGVQAERNFAPLDSLDPGNASIVLLGMTLGALRDEERVHSIENLAKRGAVVVLSLDGTPLSPVKAAGWDLEIRSFKNIDDEDSVLWPAYIAASSKWHVIRMESSRPVVVERAFGTGLVAVSASTAPFLNVNLRENRDLALLNWAQRGGSRVVFDESHLGSAQNGTIVGLMRRFRLQGIAAALIAAALLFVWRASTPFPPVPEPAPEAAVMRGTGSDDALRNLLERRIAPAKVIEVCVQEWGQDFARRAGPQTVQDVSRAAEKKATETERWETIRGIIHSHKKRTT
jgi:hypothetical protein